jgi:pyrroline-5-carboxylate reductase
MFDSSLTIGFIGAGNMASALIEGLLATGLAADRLFASDPSPDKRAALQARGLHVSSDNEAVLRASDVLILAVKPQVLAAVVGALHPVLASKPVLLISVAAGVTTQRLADWTPAGQAIVRCMPNTPALVQAGATALYANASTSAAQRGIATAILQAVGLTCWLEDEAQMDAVTALSGSGPAYFFLMLEALEAAAVQLGLPAPLARQLATQTAFGAAKLALGSDVDAAELRRRVTSPGGTTEAALKQFDADHFRHIVARAVAKAAARSAELANA